MDAARESSDRHSVALERARAVVLGALVVQIPFELESSFLGLSNLQWTFVILGIVSVPLLIRYWRDLKRDRLAQAAGLCVVVQWIAASYAPEFNGNAYKAAIRFTAGLLLMLIVRYTSDRRFVFRVWVFTAIIAALYALVDQAGYGLNLFRNREFFIAQVQRLSGSFEYPNVAAAYFVISLPLLWRNPFTRH